SRVPDLFFLGERLGARGTLCLIEAAPPRLALLAWADESAPGGEVCVLTHRGGDELAERLQQLLVRWVSDGRPRDTDAVVRAYARNAAPAPQEPGEVAVDERWTRFILSWPTLV